MAVVLGAGWLTLMAPLWGEVAEGPGAARVGAAMYGVPLCMLIAGSIHLRLIRRQRDEEFVLFEGGLTYRRGEDLRVIPWEEIIRVGNHQDRNIGALRKRLGYDVWCRVRTRNHGRLLITGFTERAAELANAVERGSY